ncbi:MAG: hypothetical protein ACO3K0_01850 [Steroidobacteraceae bacterium]
MGKTYFFTVLALALAGCGGSSAPTSLRPLPLTAGAGSAQPHLAHTESGAVVLSWLEPDADATRLLVSRLGDGGWSEPAEVARGDDWFVNWADFPSVLPSDRGAWTAHWLQRRPEGGYAYDVVMATSADVGANWQTIGSPHDDGTPTEHGFVTLFPWDGGTGVIWLDGRETGGGGHSHGAQAAGGMTLRAARVAPDGSRDRETVLDELTCDCCQTDVTVATQGPVVVYRDRSRQEVRDIAVVRHDGTGWTEPKGVGVDGWVIEGCPVNGPAIDSSGESVVVAWFTAAQDRPRVRIAWSMDGGQHFEETIEVPATAALGRVDVVAISERDAVISWLEQAEQHASLRLLRVSAEGEIGSVREVSRTAAGRPSGFPQMVRGGDGLVLAWTEVQGESRTVRAATLGLPD